MDTSPLNGIVSSAGSSHLHDRQLSCGKPPPPSGTLASPALNDINRTPCKRTPKTRTCTKAGDTGAGHWPTAPVGWKLHIQNFHWDCASIPPADSSPGVVVSSGSHAV